MSATCLRPCIHGILRSTIAGGYEMSDDTNPPSTAPTPDPATAPDAAAAPKAGASRAMLIWTGVAVVLLGLPAYAISARYHARRRV